MTNNKNWFDFEEYAKEMLFTERRPYILQYDIEHAFSSVRKTSIFQDKESYYIISSLWDKARDRTKYYERLQYNVFDKEQHTPTIATKKAALSTDDLSIYKKELSRVKLELPFQNGLVLDGNRHTICFGDYFGKVTVGWTGNLPEEFSGLSDMLYIIGLLTQKYTTIY